jgi:hypothetical protein
VGISGLPAFLAPSWGIQGKKKTQITQQHILLWVPSFLVHLSSFFTCSLLFILHIIYRFFIVLRRISRETDPSPEDSLLYGFDVNI